MKQTDLPVITIDGPAGAGKSTLARALARELRFLYLDTGAIYRTVALAAQRASVGWCDEAAVTEIAAEIVRGQRLRFERSGDGGQRVLLDDGDVSEAIRDPAVSAGASMVSSLPGVRAALLGLQRSLAASGGVVVEGRDTGTVVFPEAQVKFFMTASAEERARRRCEELRAKGMRADFEETLRDMVERDKRDEQREAAPLRRPEGAIDLETTNVAIDDVLARMLEHVRSCVG